MWMSSHSKRLRLRAIASLGPVVVAAAFAGCGWIQQIPPDRKLESPRGQNLSWHCPSAATARSPSTGPAAQPSPVAFDEGLDGWRDREGVFLADQPIPVTTVRARDVHPRWTDPQRKTHPVSASSGATALVPIGGDYWSDTRYPVVGETSKPWVSSAYQMGPGSLEPSFGGEQLTGSMWKPFTLDAAYLRLQVGGVWGGDDPDVGVELLVEPKPDEPVTGCSPAAKVPRSGSSRGAIKGLETYVTAAAWHGEHNQEAVDAYELNADVPGCRLRGRKAALRIFDHSLKYHVNVGTIELSDVSSGEKRPGADAAPAAPVWGFADFHTHPTDYLGFGGLQGIHTLWGSPGGDIHDYVGPGWRTNDAAGHDIPPCDAPGRPFNGHHGGFAAPLMLNVAESRTSGDLDDVAQTKLTDVHPSEGSPAYTDHPDYRRGSHEQYHVTQIHRAYLGGLRLMSALAIHNRGLEYGAGWVTCGPTGRPTVDTTLDLDLVRAHVQAMRELASLNQDWMQIAYSPRDAREIIRANKLAVVLGVEVPQLGEEPNQSIEQQVTELDELGVRQVIIVHGMDNLLGGTALFNDLYNAVNDWMHRGDDLRDEALPLSGALLPHPFGGATFFEVTTEPRPEQDPAHEPILFRLGNPYRIVLSDVFPHPSPFTHSIPFIHKPFGPLHPLISLGAVYESERGPYDQLPRGHRNKRGLTGLGRDFVKTLMEHGMLVDMSHMSDETVFGTYGAADDACPGYPLMVSHAHLRGLAIRNDYTDRVNDFVQKTAGSVRTDLVEGRFPMDACVRNPNKCDPPVWDAALQSSRLAPWYGPGTVDPGNLPREYDLSTYEVGQLSRRGGSMGVFLGQGAIDASPVQPLHGGEAEPDSYPFRNDCAGSSKSFVAAMLFAQQQMDRGAVGIASDFTQVSAVTPRFGPHACAGYEGAGHGSASGVQLLETLVEPDQYAFNDQRDPVLYRSGVASCVDRDPSRAKLDGVACGKNAPLEPYVLGRRVYDFNVDGLAHYGLVPDMLQDASNDFGRDVRRDAAFARLFRSAEGYVQMWEAAQAMAGCGQGGPCAPAPVENHPEACGDACPCSSWNGGAPLQLLDELYDVCDVGQPIRFLTKDSSGHSVDATPKYQQRRAKPYLRGDMKEQGDWAVYPIRTRQTWRCGNGGERELACPSGANYVKVRRVLDTTVGATDHCAWQELPPEVGNRRVVMQCLAGPPDTGRPWRQCP